MKNPCLRKTFYDRGDPWCPIHGTLSFGGDAWDLSEFPSENRERKMWTQEEEGHLKALHELGLSIRIIARRLQRSPDSVYSKLWYIRNVANARQ